MVHKGTKEYKGVVKKALPDTLFRVELEDGREILAYLSGRMRRYRIRVLPGDRVNVEMTKYDEKKGRIIYRYQ